LFVVKVENVSELRNRIVRAAECVTNEILVHIWRETEYRLYVCRTTNDTNIQIS